MVSMINNDNSEFLRFFEMRVGEVPTGRRFESSLGRNIHRDTFGALIWTIAGLPVRLRGRREFIRARFGILFGAATLARSTASFPLRAVPSQAHPKTRVENRMPPRSVSRSVVREPWRVLHPGGRHLPRLRENAVRDEVPKTRAGASLLPRQLTDAM